MYRISLTFVLLAFLMSSHAQSCSEKAPPADKQKMEVLLGKWEVEFIDNGKSYPLSIKFYEANQELKVKITTAALLTSDMLADASLCSTNNFHFFGHSLDEPSFRYNARLVNGELIG